MRAPPRFSLPFAAHRSFRAPPQARNHVASVGMIDQIDRYCLNAIRFDQLRSLGPELRELQNRDFGRIVHRPKYTAPRYRKPRIS